MVASHRNDRRAIRGLFAAVVGLSVALPASFLPASTAVAADTQFTFTGRGYGHGIGLSQWGAQGYAKRGWGYSKILTHYYRSTRVAAAPSSLTVKVNIDQNANPRTSWKIRSGSTGRALTMIDSTDTKSRVTLAAGATWWVTVSAGNVRVHADSVNGSGTSVAGKVVKTFSGGAYATTGGSNYLIQVIGSSGPFATSGVRWRGELVFTPSGTSKATAVNRVGMEQYLYGVVPRESPASFATEALKAQAVAARSYAYTSAAKGQTLFCTVMSQVYNGHSSSSGMHENPATNAAVDATRRQVVMYGTDVVKTFFFSSSGGHTANVEDVWVTSEPKPYYKGVADADTSSPYGVSWGSALKLSGSALAIKIRDYDYGANKRYDFSVAAPATVTSLKLERAASGFVRYVNVTWSNGAVYPLRGTTLQSILRLKSSKFYVGAEYPPPLSTAHYREGDSRIAYKGRWNVAAATAYLDGAQAWSASVGASCTVAFKGSGLAWVGTKSPSAGKANVFVDGVYSKTVDLYSASPSYRRTLWSVGGLSTTATHTVTFQLRADTNAASKGHVVSLDRISVFDGALVSAPQTAVVRQEGDYRIARVGEWTRVTGGSFSGGAQLTSRSSGARAIVSFVGRGVSWLGSRGPSAGSARVSIDGGPFSTVSLRAATAQNKVTLWSKSGLAFGDHTVIIEVATPASANLKGAVSLDAVRITGGELSTASIPWLRVQEGAPSVTWSGPWSTVSSSAFSYGKQKSAAKPAVSTFRFSGTAVRWIGSRSRGSGKATVSIDGGKPATIDLYSFSPVYQRVIWSRSGLPNANHTLTIRVLGSSRAGATGRAVAVDAFDVRGVGRVP